MSRFDSELIQIEICLRFNIDTEIMPWTRFRYVDIPWTQQRYPNPPWTPFRFALKHQLNTEATISNSQKLISTIHVLL